MKVLGIESSCDETGIAVLDTDSGEMQQRLYSQIERHREYGGVVPELASRDHVAKAGPMIVQLLEECGGVESLHGIVYTRGPGLMGALMVAERNNNPTRNSVRLNNPSLSLPSLLMH